MCNVCMIWYGMWHTSVTRGDGITFYGGDEGISDAMVPIYRSLEGRCKIGWVHLTL